MNVLFLNYEFPPLGGGGANATCYLLREFSRMPELNVDLITSSPGRIDQQEKFADNITIYRLNVNKKQVHYWTQREVLRYLYRAYFRARELAGQRAYDVCHAFFGFPAGLVAYWMRRDFPYIVSLRGSDVPGFNVRFSTQYIFLKPLFRKIWDNAAAVIANSRGLRELALQTAPRQPIGIIYNGIDLDEFSPSPPSVVPQFIGERGFNLLCISRLIGRKGVDFLISAMPKVLAGMPQTRLTIVGEGNLLQQLQDLARTLKVDTAVNFMGYQPHDNLPGFYRQADIFILPSQNEGMSNTVLEAMACGLPVITTDTGGTGELINGNGIIVPMRDAGALTEAILHLLADQTRLRAMGRRSRELVQKFGWKQVAEDYYKLYLNSIGRAFQPCRRDGNTPSIGCGS